MSLLAFAQGALWLIVVFAFLLALGWLFLPRRKALDDHWSDENPYGIDQGTPLYPVASREADVLHRLQKSAPDDPGDQSETERRTFDARVQRSIVRHRQRVI